jgi:hypothetical protein
MIKSIILLILKMEMTDPDHVIKFKV